MDTSDTGAAGLSPGVNVYEDQSDKKPPLLQQMKGNTKQEELKDLKQCRFNICAFHERISSMWATKGIIYLLKNNWDSLFFIFRKIYNFD